MRHQHTFLTGGTGTLGLELIPRLLERDLRARVTLLLRADGLTDLAARLRTIQRYLRTYWPGMDLSRLRAVRGDVTLPHLGLGPAVYRQLQDRTTQVVHAAASTKLDPPLATVRRTNVHGTENALRLAAGCPHLDHFAYLSTAYVAGDRAGHILERDLACGQGFLNSYQRSKYEAELRVRARRDSLPITILRPSIIMGDSRDGHLASLTNIYLPLAQIAAGHLRQIPGPGSTPLDLVTVDYVADAVVQLLHAVPARGETYHLTAGRENLVMARELVAVAIRQAGCDPHRLARFADDTVPTPDLTSREPSTPAERLRVFFAHLTHAWEFDDQNTVRDLGRLAAQRPRPQDYLPRLFAFCKATRWGSSLPQDRLDPMDPPASPRRDPPQRIRSRSPVFRGTHSANPGEHMSEWQGGSS